MTTPDAPAPDLRAGKRTVKIGNALVSADNLGEIAARLAADVRESEYVVPLAQQVPHKLTVVEAAKLIKDTISALLPTALRAERDEAQPVADETMRVLVEAAIPLEVLAAQIKQKRYAELSADFQDVIMKTVDLIRTHVSGAHPPADAERMHDIVLSAASQPNIPAGEDHPEFAAGWFACRRSVLAALMGVVPNHPPPKPAPAAEQGARERALEAALRNALALGRVKYGNTDESWNTAEVLGAAALRSTAP